MDFVKRQLFLIICGSTVAASIGLGAWGMMNKTIEEEMVRGARLASELTKYTRGPQREDGKGTMDAINEEAIRQLDRKIQLIQKHHQLVLTKAEEINGRKMLLEGVFPEPKQVDTFRFQEKYTKAIRALPELLNDDRDQKLGVVPTEHEVAAIEAMMEDKRAKEEANKVGLRRRDQAAGDASSQDDQDAMRDRARRQACVKRAWAINCYMSPTALVDRPIDEQAGRSPTAEQMWHAQMTYIIQEDVIRAIKQINQEAAEQIKAKKKPVWVGNLPVKDVRKIMIGGGARPDDLYVVSDARERRRGSLAQEQRDQKERGPDSAEDVFTKRASCDEYDVIHFSVELVVDARDIPSVISGICKINFYVPLNVFYKIADPSLEMVGQSYKIYGSEPTVLLIADFEGYFFRGIYTKFMPSGVKEILDIRETRR